MRLLDRRRVLAGLATLGTAAGAGAAEAGHGTLLVAGPAGSRLDRWAELLGPVLGHGLPGRAPLLRSNIGGLDGVTGANQFEAWGEPDGSVAMLVPGSAALSWMVGETRARFDPARWIPLWAVTGSAVLVSRVALAPGRPLLVGAAGPAGPELPALLALDLLGIPATPTPPASADALFFTGRGLAAALAVAHVAGMEPVFTLGAFLGDGEAARDPVLPTVPTAQELVRGSAPGSLVAALQATALAVQLDAGLVLPQLTPAGAVALWRRACTTLAQDPAMVDEAAAHGIRPVSLAMTARCTSGLAGDPATLMALRQWLATRYDWRPA